MGCCASQRSVEILNNSLVVGVICAFAALVGLGLPQVPN